MILENNEKVMEILIRITNPSSFKMPNMEDNRMI